MTLCIAQKVNSTIFLASDSRINAADRHSDQAIKVLPLNISISSPTDFDTGKKEKLYSTSLGFAFSGSFAAQNAIHGFLSIALQNLQYIPVNGPLSFKKICDYVMDLYNYVSDALSKSKCDTDIIDFFLCGTCPENKIVKLAKFSIDYGDSLNHFNPIFKVYECDKEFPLAIGSGNEQFIKKYLSLNRLPLSQRALAALKQVIDDEGVASVGGNIQYGECSPGNPFIVKGVTVPEYYGDGAKKKNHFCLGGIDVLDDVFSEGPGLYMSGEFIKHFS